MENQDAYVGSVTYNQPIGYGGTESVISTTLNLRDRASNPLRDTVKHYHF